MNLGTLANCENEKYLIVEPETATFDKEYPGRLVLVAEEVTYDVGRMRDGLNQVTVSSSSWR